jgi:hypothetical protein
MLAKGKTAFGSLEQLEKGKQLSAPASEILKQARLALEKTPLASQKQASRLRVERFVKAGEGVGLLAQAAAKVEPMLGRPAAVFSGVFAAADMVDLVTSPVKKSGAEKAVCLTGDMLVIANAVCCLYRSSMYGH